MPEDERYPAEKLVPYDPAWVERFTRLSGELCHALGADWTVEHVGSTSVPDLLAKPVVDLAVRVPEGHRRTQWARVFQNLGWSGPVATGDHQALFLHEQGVRCAIAHVFTADQWPDAHVRLFAAWLRTHAAEREQYAALKRDLVRQGVWGSDYTEAKRTFVQDMVNHARHARGLAPITL